MSIQLTKKALANVNRVVEIVYQYLHNIRDAGPQKAFFDELNDVGAMNFKYSDKSGEIDTVVSFTRSMHQFTDENIDQMIRSKYITNELSVEQIQKYTEMLCQTDNLNIYFSSQTLKEKCDKVAEWYDTKYTSTDFSEDLIQKMKSPKITENSKKLALPPANNLIAKNLDVLAENL